MKLSEFDYKLPKGLIAQKPAAQRHFSRLMVVGKRIAHKKFYNIIDYLKPNDVLVLNETKVIPAKFTGRKETGANVELIVSHKCGKNTYECRIKATKPRVGNKLLFKGFNGEIIKQDKDIFTVRFSKDISRLMKKLGTLPTPPYIKRKIEDYSRYQTVYARKSGSVAAPTAGLHFTPQLLAKIENKGVKIAKVCLHIGFGTFFPIRNENISEHRTEREYFEIPRQSAKIINNCKGRLICVGTTSLKTVESACDKDGRIRTLSGWSDLFIYPGYKFKSKTEMLITNFHLPKSTLLLLVCAFAGKKKIFSAYREAIRRKYRFYSFGDAMLLFREKMHPQ